MKFIALLLICLQLTPAFGLSPSIEVIRVGSLSKENQTQFPKLEKQLQRAFENNSEGIRVNSNGLKVSQVEYENFQEEQQLKTLARKLRNGTLDPQEKTQFKLIQDKWERLGKGGAELQESFFVEAYSNWKKNEKKKAERLVSRALALHPEGGGEFGSNWFDVEGESVESLTFNVMLDSKRSRIVRACEVFVSGVSSKESIYVNGFWLNHQKNYHFQTGRIYRVSRGPSFEPVLVSCGRLGSLQVALPTEHTIQTPWEKILAGSHALIFVRDSKNLELDSFSVGKPLRKSVILYNPKDTQWTGLSNEDLSEFAAYHRLKPMDLAVSQLPRVNPQPAPSLVEHGTTPWYNSWVFWTITGVVAAGGVTYLLTRGDGKAQVGTNFNGVRISLE